MLETRKEKINEARKILAGLKAKTTRQDLDAVTIDCVLYWGDIPIIEYSKEQLIKMIYIFTEYNFNLEELENDNQA